MIWLALGGVVLLGGLLVLRAALRLGRQLQREALQRRYPHAAEVEKVAAMHKRRRRMEIEALRRIREGTASPHPWTLDRGPRGVRLVGGQWIHPSESRR